MNEKLINEETKWEFVTKKNKTNVLHLNYFRMQKYKNENELLTNKIDKSECEVNELIQINEVNNTTVKNWFCILLSGTSRRIFSCTNSIRSITSGF